MQKWEYLFTASRSFLFLSLVEAVAKASGFEGFNKASKDEQKQIHKRARG